MKLIVVANVKWPVVWRNLPSTKGPAVSFREMRARNAERLKRGLSSEGKVRL